MRKVIVLGCAATALMVSNVAAQTLSDATLKEAQTAIKRGLDWLATNQKDGGFWSDDKNPAMTALPLWAMAASGQDAYAPHIEKAVTFVLSKAQQDGGIYTPDPERGGAGLGNYNTSVCMMGLHATGRKDVVPVILKARDFTAASQLTGDDDHGGGFGYDRGGRRHTDLTNTGMAIDAMRRTQDLEEQRPAGEKRADLNWDAALKYVDNMQQKDGEDKGGFLYVKSFGPAPAAGGKGGGAAAQGAAAANRPALRSYGSITYVGLLSMIHSQLTRQDPRVRSAMDYATKHWSLDENPGQGAQGIYFYYNILTRALSAAGEETIKQQDGTTIKWREELIKKVLSLQQDNGSWVNDNNRWWEGDPVLVTSYTLLALEFATGVTK